MRRCFIFAAGSFYGLRERPVPGDLVIAADAGYRICRGEGIVPDLLLGDFDSMEPPAGFAQVRRLPVEKDDTDTLAALRAGLAVIPSVSVSSLLTAFPAVSFPVGTGRVAAGKERFASFPYASLR